jgi:hypothetical protein
MQRKYKRRTPGNGNAPLNIERPGWGLTSNIVHDGRLVKPAWLALRNVGGGRRDPNRSGPRCGEAACPISKLSPWRPAPRAPARFRHARSGLANPTEPLG